MSLTALQKKELISEMSLANYTLGSLYNLMQLKMSVCFGRRHEEGVKTTQLWVKNIREELP